MKVKLLQCLEWCSSLVEETDQITHNSIASMGKCMGWCVFFLDSTIVIYIVRHSKVVPHADIVFNFLEVLTFFILSFAFSHKILLLKGKFSFPALDGGGGNGGDNGHTDKPEQPTTAAQQE